MVAVRRHGISVVVVARLAGIYQVQQHLADQGGVLELVARRTDGQVEAIQRGPVVDGQPVGRDVVDPGQPCRTMRHGQVGKATGQPPDLGLEALHGGGG